MKFQHSNFKYYAGLALTIVAFSSEAFAKSASLPEEITALSIDDLHYYTPYSELSATCAVEFGQSTMNYHVVISGRAPNGHISTIFDGITHRWTSEEYSRDPLGLIGRAEEKCWDRIRSVCRLPEYSFGNVFLRNHPIPVYFRCT